MKNKIKIIVLYIIFLTILSGINSCANSIEHNIQISGQLTQTRYEKTSEIENLFKKNLNLGNRIIYTKVPRGLVVSTDSTIFFDEGKDEIKENSKQVLNKIGELIKILDKPCVIEGNSNSQHIESPYYSTNWEMSIVRAEKIAQYLIKKQLVDPQKIRAVGFGQMMPFAQNVSYTGGENQRIDFVIINYEQSDFNLTISE